MELHQHQKSVQRCLQPCLLFENAYTLASFLLFENAYTSSVKFHVSILDAESSLVPFLSEKITKTYYWCKLINSVWDPSTTAIEFEYDICMDIGHRYHDPVKIHEYASKKPRIQMPQKQAIKKCKVATLIMCISWKLDHEKMTTSTTNFYS